MGKIVILLFFVIGFFQTISGGTITPPLQKQLDSLGLNEVIRVIVYLKEHADVSHIPVSNKLARIAYLKEFARKKQRAILQYAQMLGGLDIKSFWVFNGFDVTLPADKIPVLAARSEVDYITCNTAMLLDTLGYGGGAPQPQTQWNIIKVRANEVWSMGYYGEGIVVGNMDTGVLVTHEAFGDRWREENGWFDAVEGQPTPIDEVGHGTHCMGILTGAGPYGIGVAPGATFIAVRIGKYLMGWNKEDVLDGFQWVADLASIGQEPDVISNSWGWADDFPPPYGPTLDFWESINTWRALGIIPVYCIGNTGWLGDSFPWDPGKYPTVIGVGATDEFDDQARFSLPGPSRNEPPYNEIYYWSRPDWNLIKPDLMAPGTKDDISIGIYSAYNDGGYEYLEGTSQSTPHVTGAIALMLEASRDKWHYDLNYYDIYNILLETANRQVSGPPNIYYGWGRLDCYAAVNAVLNYHLKSSSPAATASNNADRVAFGGNKWHLVYESGGPMAKYVRYTVSTNNGATWSLEANGANRERIGKIGEGGSPALSVLPNGDAHVVWLDGSYLMYSKKLTSSSVWTEPIILYSEESMQKTPCLVVDPSANIGHVTFVNEGIFGKKIIYGWFDTQAQNPVLDYFVVDQGEVSNPSIGLGIDGPHIAWCKAIGLMRAIYYTCAPDWAIEQISSSVKNGIFAPDLVVTPYDGTVAVVWEEKNGNNFDIRCREKVGGVWQPLEWVCQTDEESRHPVIAANAFKGHFYVVWADSTADYDWEILFSMNDGSGWQSPENLSGFTYPGSKNPQIGFLSNETGVGDMALIGYTEGNSDPLLMVNSRYVPVYDIMTVAKFFPVGGGPQSKTNEPIRVSIYAMSSNPLREQLKMAFNLLVTTKIRLQVFDILGRCIKVLADGEMDAGRYEVIWAGRDESGRIVADGVYFLKFSAGDYVHLKKIVLVK